MTEAFSKDGYIINQLLTDSMPYGKFGSRYNGCGWISAFNLLKIAGRSPDYKKVNMDMEQILPFGGLLGTMPSGLIKYLKRSGLQPTCKFVTAKLGQVEQMVNSGILLYWTGATFHYVTFLALGNGLFRFFNAISGEENHIQPFADFFKDFVKFPVGMMFCIKNK